MDVGQRIYILPENLYKTEEMLSFVPSPKRNNNGSHRETRNTGRSTGHPDHSSSVIHFKEKRGGKSAGKNSRKKRLAWAGSLAAMLMVCLLLFIPQFTDKAYAEVSLDGDSGVQLELDKDFHLLRASSPDGSVEPEQLKELQGNQLTDIVEKLQQLCGSDSLLMGYSFCDPHTEDPDFIAKILDLFRNNTILLIPGQSSDIEKAEKVNLTIGQYLLKQKSDEQQLENVIESLSTDDMQQILEETPKWTQNATFIENLQNSYNKREEQWNAAAATVPPAFIEPAAIPVTGETNDDWEDDADGDDRNEGNPSYASAGRTGTDSSDSRPAGQESGGSSGGGTVLPTPAPSSYDDNDDRDDDDD